MASRGTVAIKFVGDISNLNKSIDQVNGKLGGFKSAATKIAAVAGGALAGAKAFDFLSTSISDAADENQGIEVLAKTMRNTVHATDEQSDAVERWITKMQNATGIMDDELRPAMGKLLIAGRSVKQAEHDMGVAADIAAARHLDLATVVNAMSKAAQGNTGALGRLGIATKDASGETLTYDQILQQASKTMGGSAAAAADTAAGKAAILRAKFADLKENIGNALMPVLEKLTTALTKITDWFNKLSPGMQKAVLIGGALVVAIGPLAGLITSITTVVGALSAALAFLAANPVVLAVAAAALLVAGLVLLYQKSETFRKAVDAMGRVAAMVFQWLKDHIDLLLVALGPLGLGIVALRHNWEKAWGAMTTAVDKAWGIMRPILEKVGGALKFIGDQLNRIPGVGGGGGGGGSTAPIFGGIGGAVSGGFGVAPPPPPPSSGSGPRLHAESVGAKTVVNNYDLRGIRDPYAVAEIVNRTQGGNLGLAGGV